MNLLIEVTNDSPDFARLAKLSDFHRLLMTIFWQIDLFNSLSKRGIPNVKFERVQTPIKYKKIL